MIDRAAILYLNVYFSMETHAGARETTKHIAIRIPKFDPGILPGENKHARILSTPSNCFQNKAWKSLIGVRKSCRTRIYWRINSKLKKVGEKKPIDELRCDSFGIWKAESTRLGD